MESTQDKICKILRAYHAQKQQERDESEALDKISHGL